MYNNRQFWMDNVKFGWSCPMTSHYFNPCNKKGHIADICHSICRLDKHEDDNAFDKEEQTYNVNQSDQTNATIQKSQHCSPTSNKKRLHSTSHYKQPSQVDHP